jgi:hypothetical protein
LTLASAAQNAKKPQSKSDIASAPVAVPPAVLPLVTVIEVEAFNRANWYLMKSGNKDYHAKSGSEAAVELENWAKTPLGHDTPAKLIEEHRLISKNLPYLKGLAQRSVNPLIYTEVPIRLASKDGALVAIISSVASRNVYNTLRLDAKERAAKEITDSILPEIRYLAASLSPDYRYYGVIGIYGTKDLSKEDDEAKGELVALVASAGSCRKLANAEMTEEDFVAVSDVYIVDRDDLAASVRKVKITLGKD